MSWLLELKDASYKGVPFRVDIAELQFGFDVQVDTVNAKPFEAKEGTEFARLQGSESIPYVDIGERLPNQLTISAHFSGLNYKADRDAFIEAITQGGAGELVLPTHEPITVIPGKAAVQFNSKEGGWETVKVQFIEFNAEEQPGATVPTRAQALTAVDASQLTFKDAFNQFGVEGGARWIADGAATLTEDVSSTINGTLGLGAVGDGLEAATAASLALAQNATDLIYTPTALVNQIQDAVSALTFAFEQPVNAFSAQLQLFETYADGQPDYPAAVTETDQQAIDNQNAFNLVVQNLALSEAGRAAVLSSYATQQDAQRALARFETAVRAQQLVNGNDPNGSESYYALAELLAAVSAHIVSQGSLPALFSLRSGGTALSLAADLYGDAGRAAEIVDRNGVRNPLFLPETVEVLSF